MNNENINLLDESKVSELLLIIKDTNPKLFEKITENNNERYLNKEFISLSDNFSLDKIQNVNNIQLDDLLNMNNISNLKMYYKPLLIICRIYTAIIYVSYKYKFYFNGDYSDFYCKKLNLYYLISILQILHTLLIYYIIC